MSPSVSFWMGVLINTAFAALAVAFGAGVGWWLRGRTPLRPEEADRITDHARESLSQLQQLAVSVAADVGLHHSQVEAINQRLARDADHGATQEAVLAGLAEVLKANEQLQSQLANAEQRLEEQARELENHALDARTDPLTQLANRRGFDDALARRYAEWQRRARPHCLLLLDVDHFKKFNDAHGHPAGDAVLQHVAWVLKSAMREMDVVARPGGEEFAVILPDTTAAEARVAAERARAAIEAAVVQFEGKNLRVMVSAGLAEIMPSDDPPTLIRRADEALYASKQAGRNRVSFHDGVQCVPLESLLPAVAASAADAAQQEGAEKGDDSNYLPSHTHFRADLKRRVAECHRFNGALSVLLVEVKNFDEIHQQFGDELAAQVINTVGDFLATAFREMDMVARCSRNMFGAMLPGTPLGGARVIAARVFDAVSACRLPLGDEEISLSIGLGLAEYQASDNAEILLQRAEKALEASRASGLVAVQTHTGERCAPLKDSPASRTAGVSTGK